MNPAFKIWFKAQVLYAIAVFIVFLVFFLTSDTTELTGIFIAIVLIVVVEGVFSTPTIIILAFSINALKKLNQDIHSITAISVIIASSSLYACAYLMAYLLFRDDFHSVHDELLFHLLTVGIIISTGIIIQIHRKELYQYCNPNNELKN